MNRLVSIIITVYNKEKFIERCLKSVINQSYSNIEIIIVDDGSTDNSYDICNIYADKDKRIKLFRKSNGGVSSARNYGITKCVGEKVAFIDGDDYVHKDYTYNLMKYEKYDLVVCGYFSVYKNKIIEYNPKEDIVTNRKEILLNVFNYINFNCFCVPYLKLFELKIIKDNNILFKESLDYGEDTCFVFEYMRFIDNIKISSKAYYYNNIVEGTLSRRYVNNIWYKMLQVFNSGYQLLDTNRNLYIDQVNFLYMRCIKLALFNESGKYRKFKKICNEIEKDEYFKKINNKNFKHISINSIIYYLIKYRYILLLYIAINLKTLFK